MGLFGSAGRNKGPARVGPLWRTIASHLPATLFVGGLCFLAFFWGVAATKWQVFPHRFLVKIESGFVALTKMEDITLPLHIIREAAPGAGIGAITRYGAGPEDQLILMTGGFFDRMDICPDFGCMAMIMDHDGTVLHSWEFDPEALFTAEMLKGFTGTPHLFTMNVQGAALGPDGSLTVTFQGRNIFPYQIGVAKFAWDGTLQWVRTDKNHHWPTVAGDGTIYTPVARIERGAAKVAGTQQDLDCKFGAVYQEGVEVLSPGGDIKRTFWFDDLVRSDDLQGLAYSVRDDCDPYHVNGIAVLNAAAAARIPGTRTGDIVVSLRSSSSLVVLDPDTGEIKKVIYGPMVAQHSPVVLPDGDLIVFDNMGGIDTKTGTRILRIDPVTDRATKVFPVDLAGPGGDLFSKEQGSVRVSADGRFGLIAETLTGRVIEFDLATGKTTWIYEAVTDAAPIYKKIGKPKDGPVLVVWQSQGADYVSRADFQRFSGM